MKYLPFILFVFPLLLLSCKKDDVEPSPEETSMYFPSSKDTVWQRKSMSSMGWNESAVPALLSYLEQKHTKSFLILVNGRIVMENYMNGHSASEDWEWNSAGKTLVASTVGIAQQEGYLNINNKANQYLGSGWTNESIDKENLITVRHLLTMTAGFNDGFELVIKSNLNYLADAGTRWSYSNVFQKLMDVVSASTNKDFETYFNSRIKDKIGMEGYWNFGLIYKIYHSNTRSMARFGLLALNRGKWNGQQIMNESYFNDCIQSSQSINPSYGYLWWLNGKNSYMVPGGQTVYTGSLVPNAPADMYAAMGAKDQRIYVIPSKNMVVVRMGEASDPDNPNFAVSGFDNALWEKMNAVIK